MSTLMATEDFLTVEQVADLLQLKPRTVRNRIKYNLLPARKMVGGRDWRIRRADALALLPPSLPALSPLIDRLGTSEGRDRALVLLQQLGQDRDEDEQRASWERLPQALEEDPVRLRRWNTETWERQDEAD